MTKSSPIVGKRKIIKLSKAYYISIPKEWFEAQGIDPEEIKELLIVADKDIRVVNPEHEKEVYEEVSKIARKVKI